MAPITLLVKLGGLLPMMEGPEIWLDTLACVVTAVTVGFLWRGGVWIQRLAAGAFLFSGCLMLLKFVSSLDALDLYGAAVVIQFLLGLVDVFAGLAILFRRDLNAFFRHQRDAGQDLVSPPRSRNERIRAGCLWGLVLGGGIGLLLAAHWAQSIQFHVISAVEVGEIVEVLLTGMGAACAFGVVAGLAVAVADPGIGVSTKRLVVTRGLIAAGACVVAGIVGSAIYGGLFGPASSDLPTAPGLPRAAFTAPVFALFGSPIIAAVGFVLGVALALMLREDKKPAGDQAE